MIPRSQVIVDHVAALLRETRTSLGTYAQTVAERYAERTPEHLRVVRFHAGGDAYADMRANAQLVRRWMDADANIRLPADLEEAMVLALPEPWRTRCLDALASRYGLLAVPMPERAADGDAQGVAQLFAETGRAGESLGAMLANDGRFGPGDEGFVAQTLCGLRQVLRVTTGLIAQIEHTFDLRPSLRVVGRE